MKKVLFYVTLIMVALISVTACSSFSKDVDLVPVSDAEYADYVGYQFSGSDPWGDKLTITIRTIVNGKMEWTFTDVFDDHTLYQAQEGTNIRDGKAQFDIKGNDVEHDEVTFTYQGTLELKDNLVIVTFSSGAVKTDSPEGGSLDRMAEALLDSGLPNQVTLKKNDSEAMTTYIVQEGDSLHSIAEKYGISTRDLVILNQTVIMETAKANGHECDDVTEYAKYLYPGEILVIPEKSN